MSDFRLDVGTKDNYNDDLFGKGGKARGGNAKEVTSNLDELLETLQKDRPNLKDPHSSHRGGIADITAKLESEMSSFKVCNCNARV
jgi:hypothetical protein